MSWTQVHVSGLPKSVEPNDDQLETLLKEHSMLSSCDWAGEGTTVVKRMDDGTCRGYCFLAFLTLSGATTAVDRINHQGTAEGSMIQAELCKPKADTKKEKKNDVGDERDLRLRRRRGQPVRKHPVLISSDQSKLARSTAIHKARGPG